MRQKKRLLFPFFLLCAFSVQLSAQTVIFSNSGATYTNIDSVSINNYSVDVSNCSSISFSINYNFSVPFGGPGNMESSDECPFGIPPCQGDPTDPQGGGCDQCWDFLYVQFQIDGVNVSTELIGVPGSTNQTGVLTFGPVCTNGAANAGLIVQTQSWAANESITFSNITITCWDAGSTVSANPTSICSGQSFNLQATLDDPASVASTLWAGPGTIVNPTQLNTAVNNAPVGTHLYTFTATDDNACTATNTVEVTVNPGPTMQDPPNITVCGLEQVDVVFVATNGNPDFNWTNSNTAIGLAANGTGDISFTTAGVANVTTATINITPVEGPCTGPGQSFTITVNPVPTVNQPNDVTVCGGLPVNVAFSGTSGATFSWTNDNTSIGLGASGMGNINFTTINGPNPEVATITVTPIRNGCPGAPVTFTINVNPTPNVTDPPNQIVCAGDMVDVVFTGSGNGATYNWTNNNPAIGLGIVGSGDISFVAANVVSSTIGTIQVIPTENGCTGPSQNFTVTVIPAPTANQPSNIAVCGGAPVTVSFSGSPGATFSWTNDNNNIGLTPSGSGSINFTTSQVSTQQVANILVTPTLGACSGDAVAFTITVNPAPVVTDPADQTVCSGANVAVNFTGTGSPTFAWTNNNTAIGLGANGNGNISFTAATVSMPVTGNVTVTPSANGCTGASQNFNITVTPAPSMNQPANIQACAGTTIGSAFSGTSGATFSWTNNNTAIGLAASGTGDLNFISALVTNQEVATITVTPVIGTCSGVSTTFTITLNPSPTVADPANQTICGGLPVMVAFTGTTGAVFNWANTNTSIGLGASGTGDISFTSAPVSAPTTGTITVTPSANGCSGPSQDFDITIIPAPVVDQPANQSACSGSMVNVVFTGTSGATFSWTNNNPAIGLGASGTGNISFNAAGVSAPDTATITVVPDLNGCLGAAVTFQIAIRPLPTITLVSVICASDLLSYSVVITTTGDTISASAGTVSGSNGNFTIAGIPGTSNVTITSQDTTGGCQAQISVNAPNCNCPTIQPPNNPSFSVICEGTNTPTLTVSVGPGETVDWYAAATGGLPLLSGSTSFTPPGMFPAGVYTFYAETRETSTNCTSSTRTPVNLTVNPLPVINPQSDQAACPGDNLSVNFSGTAGANFNWTNSNTGIGLGASGAGNISFTTTNTGATALVGTITATPILNGCLGAPISFNLTVNPTPSVVAPANQTVCGGSMVNVVFSGSAGTDFNWTNANTNIGLGASGMGNISFTAANVSTTELATLTVTPSAQGCVGPAQNFNISVSPTPIVTPPLSQTVCAGISLAVGFNGTSGAVFNWTNSNTSIGLGASGVGGFTFMSTNTGTTPQVGNLTVTPTLNGCSGTPQNFSITVNPLPTFSLGAVTCSPDLSTYSVVVNSNASTVTASAGTVSGAAGTFTISGIPNGVSIIVTATNAGTGCNVQQSVNAPNCTCPPIAAPSMPNFPVICEGTATPAMMVNVGAGLTVDWYAAATGGMPLLSGSTSYTPPGIFGPGSYTFYAETRDPGSNCTSATRTPVFLTVNALPTITQPLNQTVCSGFVISVGFNGTSGATFNWTNNNPAIGLGANGAGNISFTAINNGATPVTATLTVTPTLFGCQGTPRTFTITVNPNPVAVISGNSPICNGDMITLTASGGNSFAWNTGATTPALTVSPTANTTYTVTTNTGGCIGTASATVVVLQNTASTQTLTTCDPAAVGTDVVVIPNAAGCDSTITTNTVLDLSTCAPTATIVSGTLNCFGTNDGVLTLTAADGVPPYQYNWSNGAQTGSGQIPTAGSAIQIPNLAAGNYTVTVTSSNGLTTTASGQITAPNQLAPMATAVTNFGQFPLSCHDATDATVQAAATGGTGQYQFSWSVPGNNNPVLNNVGAGTYTVTVTDANQCSATASAVVTPPPPFAMSLSLDDVDCGADVARAAITPINGTSPFTVSIDGVAAAGGLNPEIGSGSHLVVLTDDNNCSTDTTVVVVVPPAPSIQLPGEITMILGETLILEAVTNLQVWESISWTPAPDPLCANCLRQEWIPEVSGVYEALITDTLGCTALASTRVTVLKADEIYIPNVFSPNEDGKEDFWTFSAAVSIVALNSVQVFDRWGDEVYRLASPVTVQEWKGWDGRFRGKDVTPGVFVYYLEIQLANGETVLKKGDVTVVR